MEHDTLTAEVLPHGRDLDHEGRLLRPAPAAAGTPPTPTGRDSTQSGPLGWLIYRLQDLGIPAPASTPAT